MPTRVVHATIGDQEVAANQTREGVEMKMMVNAVKTAAEAKETAVDLGTIDVQTVVRNHAQEAPNVATGMRIRAAVKQVVAENNLNEILLTMAMFQLGILRFHSL